MSLFANNKKIEPAKPGYTDTDHINEIHVTLNDIYRRMNLAEEQNKKFNQNLQKNNFNYTDFYHNTENKLNLLKTNISELRNEIKQTINSMHNFVSILKLKAKKREFEILSDKVDEWNPEKYLTKNEFIQLVNNEFSR